MMGRGVGAIVFPPIIAILIYEYSFTGVYMVIAALHLNFIPCGALFRPPEYMLKLRTLSYSPDAKDKQSPTEEKLAMKDLENNSQEAVQGEPVTYSVNTTNNNTNMSRANNTTSNQYHPQNNQNQKTVNTSQPSIINRVINLFGLHLLKRTLFVAFCASLTLSIGSIITTSIFMSSFTKTVGISRIHLTTALSLWGATTLIARPVGGMFFDIPRIKAVRSHVYTLLLLLLFGLQSCTPFISSTASYFMYILALASLVSLLVTQELVIYGDLVERKYYPNAMGLAGLFKGVGCLVGPILGGKANPANTKRCFNALSTLSILNLPLSSSSSTSRLVVDENDLFLFKK